jgi:hypothetical protein
LEDQPGNQPNPNRRIQIDVPETYKKVDDSVWEELESYLNIGFLTSTATINDHNFIFKTLNHNEIRNVKFMQSSRAMGSESRAFFTAAFIAHSIFMIDGNNALFERSRSISRLIKIISKLQTKTQEKIIENLSYLNARISYLYPLVEVYAYENRSRFRWHQLNSHPIHDSRSTGLSGTDELGMNMCQQTWTSMNVLIDRRETAEREWSHAKFIGSCFAGKGVRPIEEKDKARLETERSEREEKKLKVLHDYLNRSFDDSEKNLRLVTLPDGRKAEVKKRYKSESADELANELSAALSGEKDYHDLVIEQKEREFRERHRNIETQRSKLMYGTGSSETPETLGTPIGAGSGSRVLGGRKEVDAYIKRMEETKIKQMEAFRKNVQDIQDNQEPFNEKPEGDT